jgi:uncharacterized membrane protein YbhN (UPF0104 family)
MSWKDSIKAALTNPMVWVLIAMVAVYVMYAMYLYTP